jgi:uncharacterized protein (TIGR02246 family)
MKKSFIRLVLVFPLALLLCLAFSCQKKAEKAEVKETAPVVNLEAEKAAVKTVIDQFMQSMNTKDIEAFSKTMAHDSDMINFGTDAAEKWMGWDSLKESTEKQFKSIDVGDISIREQVVRVHKSGEVAWFSEIIDWKGKAQGQPFSMEDFRLTGTLEKRAGIWAIVQFHASMPVSGQAVKY